MTRIEREVLGLLVEEEVDGFESEFERQRLEEGNIEGQQLFVGEVELVHDQVIHLYGVDQTCSTHTDAR